MKNSSSNNTQHNPITVPARYEAGIIREHRGSWQITTAAHYSGRLVCRADYIVGHEAQLTFSSVPPSQILASSGYGVQDIPAVVWSTHRIGVKVFKALNPPAVLTPIDHQATSSVYPVAMPPELHAGLYRCLVESLAVSILHPSEARAKWALGYANRFAAALNDVDIENAKAEVMAIVNSA